MHRMAGRKGQFNGKRSANLWFAQGRSPVLEASERKFATGKKEVMITRNLAGVKVD